MMRERIMAGAIHLIILTNITGIAKTAGIHTTGMIFITATVQKRLYVATATAEQKTKTGNFQSAETATASSHTLLRKLTGLFRIVQNLTLTSLKTGWIVKTG